MTNTPAPAAQTVPSNQVRLKCGQAVNSQLGLHELISPHLVDAVLQHSGVNLSLLPLDEGILIQLMESEELFASLLDDSGEIDPGSLAVVVATLSGE